MLSVIATDGGDEWPQNLVSSRSVVSVCFRRSVLLSSDSGATSFVRNLLHACEQCIVYPASTFAHDLWTFGDRRRHHFESEKDYDFVVYVFDCNDLFMFTPAIVQLLLASSRRSPKWIQWRLIISLTLDAWTSTSLSVSWYQTKLSTCSPAFRDFRDSSFYL